MFASNIVPSVSATVSEAQPKCAQPQGDALCPFSASPSRSADGIERVNGETHVDMNKLLQVCRYDGNRFWMKAEDGSWWSWSQHDTFLWMVIDRDVSRIMAKEIVTKVKVNSVGIVDPEWREVVAWRKYAGGRTFYAVFDEIHICDPTHKRRMQVMSLKAFNRLLRDRFPRKSQVLDTGDIRTLLLY